MDEWQQHIVKVDPNAPKRPLSAYLLFMSDFRQEYMAKYPDTKKVVKESIYIYES